MKRPFKVKKSKLHGRGLFATKRLRLGRLLAHPKDYGMNNFPGLNHSKSPNAKLVFEGRDDGCCDILVLRNIMPGIEITVKYGLKVGFDVVE